MIPQVQATKTYLRASLRCFLTRLWWHASANCAMLLTHAVRCRLDRLGLECIANHTDCLGQFLGPLPAPEQFQLKG